MVSCIIVAAGKGTRMGPGGDKLFLEINGQPVISYSWLKFDRCEIIEDIVLVIRDGTQSLFEAMARALRLTKPWRLAIGGQERQDSVWNGLAAISPRAELVAIHDGARPCVTHAAIMETVRAAAETGAGVAAQPVTDTIKESPDGRFAARTIDRSKLYAVQTPQTFRVSLIRLALEEVRRRGLHVTDDTAACELVGHRVKLVIRNEPNPKITRPEDVPLVSALLNASGAAAAHLLKS